MKVVPLTLSARIDDDEPGRTVVQIVIADTVVFEHSTEYHYRDDDLIDDALVAFRSHIQPTP